MLTSLILKNFRSHVDRKFVFQPGLNLIVGRNGAGKTSLVQAISGLVTADFGGGRLKAENKTIGSSGPSAVTGEFLAPDGRQCRVFRSISTSQAEYQIPGQEALINGSAAVTDSVLAFLGTSEQIFKQFVFAEQGEAGAVLEGTKEQRQAALNRLFGSERFEKLRKALTEHVGTCPRYSHPQEVQENLDSWLQKEQEARRSLEQCRSDLAAFPEPDRSSLAAVEKTLQSYSESKTAQYRVATAQKGLHTAQEYLDFAGDNRTPLEEFLQQLRTTAEAWSLEKGRLRQYVDSIRDDQAKYEFYLHWKKTLDDSIAKTDLICQQAVEHGRNAPVMPVGYVSPESPEFAAREKTLEDLKRQIELSLREQQLVAAGKCPTCSRPATAQDFPVQNIPALQENVQRYSRDLSEFRSFYVNNVGYRVACDHINKSLDEAEAHRKHIESHPVLCPPNWPMDESYRKAMFDQADHAARQHAQWSAQVSATTNRLEAVKRDLTRSQQELDQAQQDLAKVGVISEEDYQNALQAKERFAHLVNGRAMALSGIQHRQAVLDETLVAVDKYTRQLAESQRLERTRADLDRMSGLLKLLPAAYSRSRLARVIEEVNYRFGGKFSWPGRVSYDPASLELTCGQGDQTIRAGLLSGGEKVALGVAFRAAAVRLYAPEVGILVLDEPTAYLDADNVESLSEVLSEIGNEVASWTAQLIVVTHNPTLIAGCQAEGANVIRLGD